MDPIKLAVIGGSGVYDLDVLTEVEELHIATPFGDPSGAILVGTLAGRRVAFLPRHGRGHVLTPTEVPYRANIWALKSLGVERILSISACGSMKEQYRPRHVVIPDQIYDNTKQRDLSFFGDGLVAHLSFAEPFCPHLRQALHKAATVAGATVHTGGTFVVIEGPRFSTKAESQVYRSWGVDIIGMTAVPEAQLAREAEICYATMAHVTDYDVWREEMESVTVQMLIDNLMANAALSKRTIAALVPALDDDRPCGCAHTLETAIITRRDLIPSAKIDQLWPILARHFPAGGPQA